MSKQVLRIEIPLIAKLLLPFVLGVTVAFYSSYMVSSSWLWLIWLSLFALSLPFIGRVWKLKYFFGIFSQLFFFLLGLFIVGVQANNFHENYFTQLVDNSEQIIQLKVLEPPESKENSVKCIGEIQRVGEHKAIGKVLVYLQKSERSLGLAYGDVLLVQTTFNPVRTNGNPKEFDYARYLKIHGIDHQTYLKDEGWVKVGEDANAIFTWVYNVRDRLEILLEDAGLEDANLMVAKALILGEKESLDRETLRTYSSAGAMHVLAVSGLHVGIVMLLFSFLLAPLKRLPKGKFIFVVLIILIIWFYALITGLSSSVLRASVMFSFVIVGKELERDVSIYQSILVSAFILILINPLIIFQVGFQLSYLAVLGIVALQPKIYNLFYTRFYLLDKMWQITSVSIAAQLATFPLGLYYFHQFPNFFMLSNLIVIPLAFAILLLGIFYFALSWIPYVEAVIFFCLDSTLSILNKGVKWIEQLPYSIYWGVSIHWYEVFILYLIIILASIAFAVKSSKYLLISLGFTVLLLALNISEKWKLDDTEELVIYNVNNELAIDYFYGRNNVFIASNKLMQDEDKLLFHVKHNWFYHTGQEDPTAHYSFESENKLMEFADKLIWAVSDFNLANFPSVDLVYIYECNYIPEEYLAYLSEQETVLVIGSGVAYRLKNFLLSNTDLKVHDLKKDGAFTLDLD